jgi:hypothetical protein
MRCPWAAATVLVSQWVGVAAVRSTPLALYDFAAAECATGTFRDSAVSSTLGAFTGGSAVVCRTYYGVGVTTSTGDATMQLTSTSTTAALQTQLAASTGFSIELWLKHAVTSNPSSSIGQGILSISSTTTPNPASCENGSTLEIKRAGTSYSVAVKQNGVCTDFPESNNTAIVEGQGALHHH